MREKELVVLPVPQPDAHLIVNGQLSVWNIRDHISHRGPLLIYARLEFDHLRNIKLRHEQEVDLPPIADLLTGYIIGKVDVVDCVDSSDEKWYLGDWALVLENPQRLLVPRRYREHRNLFTATIPEAWLRFETA